MTRVHLLVSGRPQGVFFRASCAEEARRLGLSGPTGARGSFEVRR